MRRYRDVSAAFVRQSYSARSSLGLSCWLRRSQAGPLEELQVAFAIFRRLILRGSRAAQIVTQRGDDGDFARGISRRILLFRRRADGGGRERAAALGSDAASGNGYAALSRISAGLRRLPRFKRVRLSSRGRRTIAGCSITPTRSPMAAAARRPASHPIGESQLIRERRSEKGCGFRSEARSPGERRLGTKFCGGAATASRSGGIAAVAPYGSGTSIDLAWLGISWVAYA